MRKVYSTLAAIFYCSLILAQNPQMLKDIFPGNNTGTIQRIVKTTNYTFFNQDDDDADADQSLFRTDGTTGGTVKLNLSYPGYISTKAEQLTALGNKVVFAGDNFQSYGEIWASDGTQAGTVALERFQPISNRIPVVEINSMGSYAYYSVINKDAGGVNRAYLRRTDGTIAGTSLVYDFSAFTGVPQVVYLTPVNNILYFIVYDAGGTGVDQLWRSDGTNAGTYMVYNFTTANFVESYIMPAGNTIYIMIGSVISGVRQNTIWKSDGTTAGTAPVKFIGTGNTNLYPPFASIGNTLYFAGADGNGKELWKTDGTDVGTLMIADINPGGGSSNPAALTVLNNALYFAAISPTSGGELWKYSSGVASLVKDINPGAANSAPAGLTVSGNTIVFAANNGVNGGELWITDGTGRNTVMVADINPGINNSVPNTFTPGNPVYFAANNGTSGFEVFKYDNNGDVLSGPRKYYVNDNSQAGDIFTNGVGNNNGNGSKAYPFATISYALTQVQAGDSIYVDAGTYTEQITIDKGVTIIGAGQNLTFITNSSQLVAPAGPFTEYGLIQTTQGIGDVHIRDLTATNGTVGDGHTIMIQAGGSVKNCKLVSGGQGVFFRIPDAAAKPALVEGNTIEPTGIGINCQGSGLAATIIKNSIARPAGFYSGIFAGLDFGPLPQLTITNNTINNYYGSGMVVNANSSNVTENSIIGTGSFAIEQYNGNAINATCNWYGSSDQFVVASKKSGNVIFSPWLVNGTDNDPAVVGFQPVFGSCVGRQTFYVNDNSLTGDVFTTAVGNNANNGSSSAPLATITAALAKAQAYDIIIVDAGNYTEQVNINKNIVIVGAGMGKTILNGPAGPVTPMPNTGETGIIQTVNGLTDVIIDAMTIDGTNSEEQHGIFIQGGGIVTNCELRYVNDGFYFQYISTQPRTAIGNNNYVHHINYVGSLFAGNGLTATASNNVIDLNGAQYGIGFIAGYGGDGTVASFTASNNTIINFNGFGMMIGSLQTAQVHNNSITRFTGNFIQNAHTVNIDATCNWYGTTDAAVINQNMSGVTYSPWLTNGTDNDVAMGFQPVPNSCNGRNKLYVNDNSLTGDVFTTAVGSDANAGTPFAPLLTLNAALTKAQPGDSIFVDAGTYATPNLNITKSVTILGSNYNLSPNTPADRLVINPVRNANSLITGSTFTISSSDVRLEGLAFNPGAKSQVTMSTAGASSFTFKRNYSIVTSGTFLNLNGPSSITFGQASTFGNYLVDDNRFESQVTGISICISIGALNDVTVNNNTFFTPVTSAQRLLISCAPGSGGLTVNVIYSNNISNAPRNEWFSSGTVASARIENNISLNGQRSLVIQTNVAASSDIQVRNNYIESNFAELAPIQYQRTGTATPGAVANLLIENNTIVQNATGRTFVPAGILAQNFFSGGNSLVTIRRNKISFNGDYGSFTTSSVLGVSHIGNWQNINLEENEIAFNGTNLTNTVPASGQSSSGISISSDNSTSTIPATAVVNITGNKVYGFRNSVAVFDASSVAPNTYVGYGNLPAGVSVTINNNSFTGDNISINNGTIGASVSATCNWYGSTVEQDILGKVTSTVQHVPWLTNGTDNDVATGFQPVPGSCNGYPRKLYVNDNSLTGDVFTSAIGNNANNGTPAAPFATLDFALSVAEAGDSIYVDAGIYTMSDFAVNKAVTILGSNYSNSPNDPANKLQVNPTRNAESMISGATIDLTSSSISLQGLVLNPGGKIALKMNSGGNYGDISFKKNRFTINASQTQIVLIGQGDVNTTAAGLVNSGFTINDNRFEKNDASSGNVTNIYLVKNVTVDGNAFVVTGANPRTEGGVNMGTSGVVDGISITNNVFDRYAAAVTGNRYANVTITGNSIYNTGSAVNVNNQLPGSTSFQFNNNILDGSSGILPFVNYNRQGGSTAGSSSSFKAENNTISAIGVAGTTTILGAFNVTYNNGVLNSSAIIRGNTINITGDLATVEGQFIRPIFFRGNLQNVSVDHNEITLNAINLQPRNPLNVLPVCPAISMYSDNGATSVMPAGTVINVLNNKIHGYKYSFIVFDAGNANPYTGFGNLQPGITVNVHENSFTGDSVSINTGSVGAPINASCNWYGTSAVQNIISKISEGTDNEYLPYLSNGTDNDPAVGFQPVPGSCNGQPVQAKLDSYANVTCYGASNGTINITVFNGVAPYVFSWTKDGDAGFSSSAEDPTGLAPGTYHLTITDALGTNIIFNENGDIITIDVTITQPTLLTVTATGTSTACVNSASATANGGTLPYSYLWSNGATTQSITSLPAGTYIVTVTDGKGCQATASCTVTAGEAFNPSTSVTNVSCFGASNGSITITNVNGVAPFQYSINGVDFQSSNVFTGLAAGTHTITVRDFNGCTGFVTKTITQPTQLVVTLGTVQSTCGGSSTGSISVTVSGGSPSYNYQWTGPGGYSSTQLSISNLAVGNYSLAVTDSKGCTSVLPVTVSTYPAIVVTESITNVLCAGGATGVIDLTVTGGTGSGFTYLWNNGATTQDRLNLATGSNYKVTITDIGSGCSVQKIYAISSPSSAVDVTVSNQSIVDVAGCTTLGSFTAQGSGGTPYPDPDLYRYSINGVYQTSPVFSNLQAGAYTVTVKDANGCLATRDVTIVDNGSDEYESSPNNPGNNNNNNKGKAAPISLGSAVSARIGVATDVDYYKLGASNSWSGNYTITFVQPATAVSFDLVASNGTTVITPSASSGTNKQYNGLNGTYYVRVSGTNSLSCYQFTVTNTTMTRSAGTTVQPEVTKANTGKDMFDVKVLGNPSSTGFVMNVITSSDEKISMRVLDAQGRLIEERQGLQPMEILRVGERYISGIYMAEIRQGKNHKTVRLVKF